MKIKNQLVVALVNAGLLSITAHEVPVKDAYKAIKFKSEIDKANKAIDEKRVGLVEGAGIEDGQKFDERLKELRALASPSEDEQKELDGAVEKLKKFQELYAELMNDETEIDVKTMPFESFHILAKENRETRVGGQTIDIFTVFASELEGILWVAPSE